MLNDNLSVIRYSESRAHLHFPRRVGFNLTSEDFRTEEMSEFALHASVAELCALLDIQQDPSDWAAALKSSQAKVRCSHCSLGSIQVSTGLVENQQGSGHA